MKRFVLLAFTFFLVDARAQIFDVKKDRYRPDFTECQYNQLSLYNHTLVQIDGQIKSFGSELEKDIAFSKMDELRNYQFQTLFSKLVLKKAIIQGLKNQLENRNLKDHMSSEQERRLNLSQKDREYGLKPFMDYESLTLDLEKSMRDEVRGLSLRRSSIVGQYFKVTITWQFTKTVLSEAYMMFVQIGGGLFAKISMNAFKSILSNVASSLFVNVVKGTAITILVDPFLGSRLPPETEWTDLLKKYPELIIFPEWMMKAKVGDGNSWRTHCKALTTRTSFMEDRASRYLTKDQKDFERSMSLLRMEIQPLEHTRLNPTDNTRFRKPYPLR